MFEGWLPKDLMLKIVACLPISADHGNDVIVSSDTPSGSLSIKSKYKSSTISCGDNGDFDWKKIWKMNVLERV